MQWSPTLRSSSFLLFSFIQINDAGVYECAAKNRAGEIRKRFIVEPYGTERDDVCLDFARCFRCMFSAPPTILLKNETYRIIVPRNDSLTLKCPAEGYPIPITRW